MGVALPLSLILIRLLRASWMAGTQTGQSDQSDFVVFMTVTNLCEKIVESFNASVCPLRVWDYDMVVKTADVDYLAEQIGLEVGSTVTDDKRGFRKES